MAFVSKSRWALPGVLLAWSASSHAQDTVKVGQEAKRAAGTITAMNAGDIACYLTLRDDKGSRFEEMASFEICEQGALLNKRVTLSYRPQSVMSPDCQGDPACKKTRTVALVVSAKPIVDPAPAPKSDPMPATRSAAQTSFCTSTEEVVFSCRTGAKMVSVCASNDAGPARGYLQYRFGKPDSSDPLELVLPKAKVPAAKAANGANEGYSGGGGSWLRFFNGPATYTVYSGIGNWGPKGEKRIKEGLLVERDGKQVANLACTSEPIGGMSPDWFEKQRVVRALQEFFFPD